MSRIAYDLHGSLDASEELRQHFLTNHKNGNDCFVMTGSRARDAYFELKHFPEFVNLSPGCIISILDSCDKFGVNVYKIAANDSREFIDDDLWWAMKAILCKKSKIDVLIDNDSRYGLYFGNKHQTKFIHFNASSQISDLNTDIYLATTADSQLISMS